MWQETADLATFTEEMLNGKLYALCSVYLDRETDGSQYIKYLNFTS